MLTLNSEIIKISRAGAGLAKKLKKLGVATARELLFYFPFRYDDFSKIMPIKDLQAGTSANIVGRIELIQNKRSHRRRMYITEALVNDETESMRVIWFNQPFIARILKAGDLVSLAGKVEEDFGTPVMMSPVYEKVKDLTPALSLARREGIERGIHTQGLVPNYRLTAGLTHKQSRFLIKSVIYLAKDIKDWLPAEVKNELKLLPLAEAINKIHFPKIQDDIAEAKRRLAFDELFLLQLQSQMIKKEMQASQAESVKFFEKETKEFVDGLPFKLTNAQRKAAWEILRDLAEDKPMARLLEGDVGSGKTVVALIAMLNVALNGKQAVLMAPTEILARQHYESICKMLKGWDVKVGLITRSMEKANYESGIMNQELNKKKKTKNHNSKFIIHNSNIIIGTHALIQEDVKFKNLALAVIDEQHRFGVEQRKTLMDKSNSHYTPHLLSVTATPIPRSLALALYGDLDLSIINEMPADRKKIITRVVPEEKREAAYEFIRKQVAEGRQVFVICPLIDISDKLGVKSVKQEFEKLDKHVFPEIKMGMLHGRLPARRSERTRSTKGLSGKSKEEIMQSFLENKIKILVSTSVVEVGVDIPNATIMMIEGAERFGLAQLHQFRGRVGRAEHQSYCFLFTESNAEKILKRLNALVVYNDGMTLAKIDLKLRGPGEVYGTLQKGFPELKIASLFDCKLIKEAKEAAEKIIIQNETLNKWPLLKEEMGEWEKRVHLE